MAPRNTSAAVYVRAYVVCRGWVYTRTSTPLGGGTILVSLTRQTRAILVQEKIRRPGSWVVPSGHTALTRKDSMQAGSAAEKKGP